MEKCLVTGGAGFIGSHIVNKLMELNYGVIVIDDFSSGKNENLIHHKENKNLKIFNRNICDENICELFKDVSVVFHTAAKPRVQYSIDYPLETNKVNISGILNILEACRKNNVKRFVFSSSSSVYGNQHKLPFVENMIPKPMSPYALQKLVGEYYCSLYYLLYEIETISLRYFNVYGPRQDPLGSYANLIPKTINLVLKGKNPEIYGDGEQTRDFTFVEDIVRSNVLSAFTKEKKAFGNIFNIGAGKNISVNKIVNTIIGKESIKPTYKPPVVEPKHGLADISKAKEILNWFPEYNFEKGIEKTIMWFKKLNNNRNVT